LVERGTEVRVVDNLSRGKIENIQHHLDNGAVDFIQADLLDQGVDEQAVKGVEMAFHLAADHGRRGYVNLHQAACATSLAWDSMFFRAWMKAKADKVVYASSGCIYPNFLQTDRNEILHLTEDKVGPPYDADNMYG
jgi:nucleoside-diphosphate-sugar epimerase